MRVHTRVRTRRDPQFTCSKSKSWRSRESSGRAYAPLDAGDCGTGLGTNCRWQRLQVISAESTSEFAEEEESRVNCESNSTSKKDSFFSYSEFRKWQFVDRMRLRSREPNIFLNFNSCNRKVLVTAFKFASAKRHTLIISSCWHTIEYTRRIISCAHASASRKP